MSDVFEWGETSVLLAKASGPLLGADTVNDFISSLWTADAELLAVPAERLSPAFVHLETRLAGEIIQKFINHRLGLAVVGDLVGPLAASRALRDFVREANGGDAIWFVPDIVALKERLEARARWRGALDRRRGCEDQPAS